MAFSLALADRIRDALVRQPGITEKRMFGGIAFFHRGHLVVGVSGAELVARLGAEAAEKALTQRHVRPFDITGKPMTGWVFVAAGGIDSDAALGRWIEQALAFVQTLPPAVPRARRAKKKGAGKTSKRERA